MKYRALVASAAVLALAAGVASDVEAAIATAVGAS